ncbi:hypothetical protein HOJ01_04190 [bacterium]|jgi:hypothetical protein|nr:hypothetical protein [bacterium]MBT6293978.1 hypothetical protein [bacterium]
MVNTAQPNIDKGLNQERLKTQAKKAVKRDFATDPTLFERVDLMLAYLRATEAETISTTADKSETGVTKLDSTKTYSYNTGELQFGQLLDTTDGPFKELANTLKAFVDGIYPDAEYGPDVREAAMKRFFNKVASDISEVTEEKLEKSKETLIAECDKLNDSEANQKKLKDFINGQFMRNPKIAAGDEQISIDGVSGTKVLKTSADFDELFKELKLESNEDLKKAMQKYALVVDLNDALLRDDGPLRFKEDEIITPNQRMAKLMVVDGEVYDYEENEITGIKTPIGDPLDKSKTDQLWEQYSDNKLDLRENPELRALLNEKAEEVFNDSSFTAIITSNIPKNPTFFAGAVSEYSKKIREKLCTETLDDKYEPATGMEDICKNLQAYYGTDDMKNICDKLAERYSHLIKLPSPRKREKLKSNSLKKWYEKGDDAAFNQYMGCKKQESYTSLKQEFGSENLNGINNEANREKFAQRLTDQIMSARLEATKERERILEKKIGRQKTLAKYVGLPILAGLAVGAGLPLLAGAGTAISSAGTAIWSAGAALGNLSAAAISTNAGSVATGVAYVGSGVVAANKFGFGGKLGLGNILKGITGQEISKAAKREEKQEEIYSAIKGSLNTKEAKTTEEHILASLDVYDSYLEKDEFKQVTKLEAFRKGVGSSKFMKFGLPTAIMAGALAPFGAAATVTYGTMLVGAVTTGAITGSIAQIYASKVKDNKQEQPEPF